MAGKPGKLIKSKSQELLDSLFEPSSSSNGLASKVKKVFQSSPTPKKKPRAQSLNTTLGIGRSPKVFGVPLQQLLCQPTHIDSRKLSLPANHHISGCGVPCIIPPVVVKIVAHIEKHGLDQEGIYRISGNSKLVEKLRVSFDENGDEDLSDIEIYTIGSLLKLFLRQLPEPLVPDDIVNRIVKLQESVSGSYSNLEIEKMKELLTTLPKDHYRLLKYLCKHLSLVAEHTASNKMTAVSLSIVFGPNIFRCGDQLSDLKTQGYANSAFAQMIMHYDKLFFDEPEENNLRTISEVSDDVFVSNEPKKKNKPEIPQPYHVHKNAKSKLATSHSCPTSPSHDASCDPDLHIYEEVSPVQQDNEEEPVSPHEKSIDEAIEETDEKRRKRAQSESIAMVSKSKSLSDDILISRVPSPLSWNSKSSPGTSPPTSPTVTPRTSQAYNTLIGDSIQDNLFQSPEASPSSPPLPPLTSTHIQPSSSEDGTTATTATTSDNNADTLYKIIPSSSEGTTDTANSTESVVQLREETSFTRQKKSIRNRKSAVFSDGGTDDNTIQLVMVRGERGGGEGEGGGRERVEGREEETAIDSKGDEADTVEDKTVKSIRESLEKKGLFHQFGTRDGPLQLHKKDEFLVEMETREKPVPPKVSEKPRSKEGQASGSYTAHDFDYVTRQIKTLVHPTKQRTRGPKRAKPSRSSILLDTVGDTLITDSSTSSSPPLQMIEEIDSSSNLSSTPTARSNKSRNAHLDLATLSHVTSASNHVTTTLSDVTTALDHVISSHVTTTSVADSSRMIVHSTSNSHVTLPLDHMSDVQNISHSTESSTIQIGSNLPNYALPSHVTAGHVTPSTITLTAAAHVDHTRATITNASSLLTGSTSTRDTILSSHTVSSPPITSIIPIKSLSSQSVKEKETGNGEHGQIVGPKEKLTPLLVPAGWTTETSQTGSMNYEDLIIEARRLRDIIKSFERDFLKTNGRKPTSDECYPVAKENALLTATKQRIRALRSNQGTLNKTVPSSTKEAAEQFVSHSSTRLDESDVVGSLKKKETASRTVRRHQSLIVTSTHGTATTNDNPLILIMQSIHASLEEKRSRAGRSADLKLMTNDELLQEKHLVQKTLLQFEKRHGRPQSTESKAIMRPLYDRYREIKKFIQRDQQQEVVDENMTTGAMMTGDSLWTVTMLQQPPSPDTRMFEPSHQPYSPVERKEERGRFMSTPVTKSNRTLLSQKSASTSHVPLTKYDRNLWMTDDQLKRASVHELQLQLELAQTKKREQRQQLRAFETGFQEREKRPVQNEDKKKLMHNEYLQYKEVKNRISQLELFLLSNPPQ